MIKKLTPKQVAPLFLLTALVHAVALASRYDELHRVIPSIIHTAILVAHGPLLLLEGLFAGMLADVKGSAKLPLWMRIKSRPLKWSFALAFAYLSIVVLQTWDISFGPVDPTPPATWPIGQRRLWFGIMVGSTLFPSYLAACAGLIPLLSAITKPLRSLGLLGGALVASVVGIGLGYGVAYLFGSDSLSEQISSLKQLTEEPGTAIGVILIVTWVPILLGSLRIRKKH